MTYESDQVTILTYRVRLAELEQQLVEAAQDVTNAREALKSAQNGIIEQLAQVVAREPLVLIDKMFGVLLGALATTESRMRAALSRPTEPTSLPDNVRPLRRMAMAVKPAQVKPMRDVTVTPSKDPERLYDNEAVACRADSPRTTDAPRTTADEYAAAQSIEQDGPT